MQKYPDKIILGQFELEECQIASLMEISKVVSNMVFKGKVRAGVVLMFVGGASRGPAAWLG